MSEYSEMPKYLLLSNEGCPNRQVACVDTLGCARKLVVIDDCKLKLSTDQGVYVLDRRAFEPAYDGCGFLGVELDSLPKAATGALYFDVRITAALVKLLGRCCCGSNVLDRIKPVQEIPLMSEAESWEYIHANMEFDYWSFCVVARELTWVNVMGAPLPIDEGFDPSFEACFGRDVSIGTRDNVLWKLMMSARQCEEEKVYKHPYEYIARRNAAFLSARYAHHMSMVRGQVNHEGQRPVPDANTSVDSNVREIAKRSMQGSGSGGKRLKDYCKFTPEELEHLKAAHLTQDEINSIRHRRIRAKVAEEMAAKATEDM